MRWVFWLNAIFLAYTFAGYPIAVWLVSLVRRRNHRRAPISPPVAIIIAAHNEERIIRHKLLNSLALEYPADRKEIIVVSDASTDRTAEIVRSFAAQGVKLIEASERRGKHFAQMLGFQASRGEILVFTDASIRLDPQVLGKLVSNFADPTIGCVSSADQLDTKHKSWSGEKLYVRFEMWLRKSETRACSLLGASGSFFAVRRELCDIWEPEMSSDFHLPLHAVMRGLRTIMDPDCVGHYSVVRSEKVELQRKVRTIVHGLDAFFHHLALLNPFRYGIFAWQLLSHKLFRWLSPFAALSLLIANIFLWGEGLFYQFSLLAQVALYGTGLLGFTREGRLSYKLLKLANFFVVANIAALVAWWRYVSGERLVAWNPSKRD
jgi:cellulose synthase/poly-beta-1,6-N-acetylglucosamine synthase-like glycosyltransferase